MKKEEIENFKIYIKKDKIEKRLKLIAFINSLIGLTFYFIIIFAAYKVIIGDWITALQYIVAGMVIFILTGITAKAIDINLKKK